MTILHSIGKLVTAWLDYSAKVRTSAVLSQLSDRQLEDVGLARYHTSKSK